MEQYQPVDGDPFAASAVSLQPVQGDPFATGSVNPAGGNLLNPQTTPQGSMPYDLQGQSIAAYNPTWREKAAQWLYGDQPRSPEAAATIRGLTGTTGLGQPQMSVSDFTPLGGAFAAQEAARRGDYSGAGIAAMSVLPGAGVIDRGITEGVGAIERGAGEAVLGSGPIRQAAEKLEPVTGDPFTPILGYHGSPHDFPPTPNNPLGEFDSSKIGTGEGAQAYGRGHYIAENEGVARAYRDNLADPDKAEPPWFWQSNNQPLRWMDPDTTPSKGISLITEELKQRYPNALEEGNVNLSNSDVASVGNDLLKQSQNAKGPLAQQNADNLSKAIDFFQSRPELSYTPGRPPPGKMYQVQINANPDHFLDWDKPLSEQHPVVQQAIENIDSVQRELGRGLMTVGPTSSLPGDSAYHQLAGTLGDKALAEQLKQAGIPGIKYLDAGSRNPAINHPILGNNLSQDTVDNAVANAAKSASPSLPASKYDELGTNVTEALKNGDDFDAMERFVRQGDWPSEEKAAWFAALNKGREFTTGAKPNATSNYVVFDDKTIQILKKYGIGGLGIGTAAGLSHFKTQPVNNDPYSNQPPVY